MDWIEQRVESPSFFIFSDAPEWCRETFRGPRCRIVDLGASRVDPINDLRLMSACRHNIIANSTFSWWGAWLNPNPEKLVVVPSRWCTDSTQDADVARYMHPAGWVPIST